MLRRTLLFIGYALAGIGIAGLTVLLVAFGRGYSYDFSTHKIVHDGLLIMSSTPSGADISVRGKETHHHTPYHLTLQAGSYEVTVAKAGYQTWSKLLQIVPSEVTFAQYIILIPQVLSPQVGASTSGTLTATMSPDGKKLAYVVSSGGKDTLYVSDADGDNAKSVWQPGTDTTTNQPQTISSVTWSDDNSQLLVMTASASATPAWLIASDGSTQTDLTDSLSFDFTGLEFAPGQSQKLYWNSPQGLREVDASAKTVSGVIATGVVQMTRTTDRLFYVQQGKLGNSLMSIDGSGHKQQVVDALAASPSYSIDDSSYGGHYYVAVAPSLTHTATVYTDPLSSAPASQVVTKSADFVEFSVKGSFLLASSDTTATVYDINRSQLNNRTILYQLTTLATPHGGFTWLDDYHLLYQSGSNDYITEFDGGNNTIVGVHAISAPSAVSDGKSFTYVQQSGSKQRLVNIQLRQ